MSEYDNLIQIDTAGYEAIVRLVYRESMISRHNYFNICYMPEDAFVIYFGQILYHHLYSIYLRHGGNKRDYRYRLRHRPMFIPLPIALALNSLAPVELDCGNKYVPVLPELQRTDSKTGSFGYPMRILPTVMPKNKRVTIGFDFKALFDRLAASPDKIEIPHHQKAYYVQDKPYIVNDLVNDGKGFLIGCSNTLSSGYEHWMDYFKNQMTFVPMTAVNLQPKSSVWLNALKNIPKTDRNDVLVPLAGASPTEKLRAAIFGWTNYDYLVDQAPQLAFNSRRCYHSSLDYLRFEYVKDACKQIIPKKQLIPDWSNCDDSWDED